MTGGKMIPDYFFIELLSKKHLFLGKPQSENIRHVAFKPQTLKTRTFII